MITKITNTNVIFFLFLFTFSIFLNISQIYADIPVHCQKQNIQGDWEFTFESVKFTPSLDDIKTTCGHGFPDHVDQSQGDHDYSFDQSSKFKISLGDDFKSYQDGVVVGKWTPVYDEAFILEVGDKIFTAFMKYYKEGGAFKSNCLKTMIGWLIPDKAQKEKNWSCFYGNKIVEPTAAKAGKHHMKVRPEKIDTFLEIKENTHIKAVSEDLDDNLGLLQVKTDINNSRYEDHASIVDTINNMGLTWTAEIHDGFKGMSLIELNNQPKLGVKRRNYDKEEITKSSLLNNLLSPSLMQINSKNKNGIRASTNINSKLATIEQDSEKVTNYEEVIKYINTEPEDMNASELSKNWDWRNVGGKNYLPPLSEQKSCGSCYIFSALSSLEARLRIQTNLLDKTIFSRQYIVSCSIYTEGCEGGYPILVGKFASEFELIPDSCMPYKGKATECSTRCDPSVYPDKYTVSKYEYLGGHYGATSEELMMKEIRARGPMPGNIRVPWSFSYYKEGIFHHFHTLTPDPILNKLSILDKNITWEQVDHSILIVGWGEENGVKYWICMNTWGDNWGENGFFRVLRGKDECSIESMGDTLRIKKEVRK